MIAITANYSDSTLGGDKEYLTTRELLMAASWQSQLDLDAAAYASMQHSQEVLQAAVARGERVYGITQGFGPLVRYEASESLATQGLGLIAHLAVGQGDPLSPDVTRLMIWLRLSGMKRGHSGVSPQFWLELAELWNRGFTPVIPRDGSLSASGDLIPLAHAAQAFAGAGEAWIGSNTEGWRRCSAHEALIALGQEPLAWNAREALAFVNGTSASTALACHNHHQLSLLTRVAACLSGRMAYLLGANPQHYHQGLAHVRRQTGQSIITEWIRQELAAEGAWHDAERPLQEPYSLRCAPQIIGAVWDQLRLQEEILCHEALGCTDNPITYEDAVLHGGNFHAAPVGLCSDQQALCAHQLAYMLERQLALLLHPSYNGHLPMMLTPQPGPQSGLAGVQLAASSMVAKIRQIAYPASLTAIPTNLENQDHVPMALNGANVVEEIVRLSWLVAGSQALALNQWSHLRKLPASPDNFWHMLQRTVKPLDRDRPLFAEIAQVANLVRIHAEEHLS